MRDKRITRIETRNAVVAVAGLVCVGLPLLRRFPEKEFSCIAFYIALSKIESSRAGHSHINYITNEKI